jgi:competence protein ComEA
MEPVRSDDPLDLPRPPPRLTLAEWCTRTLQWIGPRRIAGSLALAAGVGVGGWWLLHAPPPPVERSLPRATTTVAVAGATSTPLESQIDGPPSGGFVVIHVAGAVGRPGLVTLPTSARVADAITAAGGPASDADLDVLNLAAPVADGSRVYVPRRGEAVPQVEGSVGGAGHTQVQIPLDLNHANAAQLEELPGVGPATAAAIVAHRETNGPFRSVDDLLDVRGIGEAKLAQFRDLVTV